MSTPAGYRVQFTRSCVTEDFCRDCYLILREDYPEDAHFALTEGIYEADPDDITCEACGACLTFDTAKADREAAEADFSALWSHRGVFRE